MSPTWGEGDLPKGDVTPYAYLVSNMGDKWEGGVKNIKKCVTSFIESPLQ